MRRAAAQQRPVDGARALVPASRLRRHVRAGYRNDNDSSAPSQAAAAPPLVRVPASIAEVDNGRILGFGQDLAPDHPGFHDAVYKQRRVDIANIARAHEVGEPIPRIAYTRDEVAVWGAALSRLRVLFPRYACREFNSALPRFDFREDSVPQLQDVAVQLRDATGWQIRPVAGLMHPRDFLAGLAFRYFHSTQYVRHPSQPFYTPEPDVVHELIGHVPMLADPTYAAMVEAIGRASLGADEKTIWHLTKVYWYTVEFGVVREPSGISDSGSSGGSDVKAFGAGILSSFGELEHMAAGGAELVAFDPCSPQPKMSYKDGYQRRYYVLQSFEAGLEQLRAYARTLQQQHQQAAAP